MLTGCGGPCTSAVTTRTTTSVEAVMAPTSTVCFTTRSYHARGVLSVRLSSPELGELLILECFSNPTKSSAQSRMRRAEAIPVRVVQTEPDCGGNANPH